MVENYHLSLQCIHKRTASKYTKKGAQSQKHEKGRKNEQPCTMRRHAASNRDDSRPHTRPDGAQGTACSSREKRLRELFRASERGALRSVPRAWRAQQAAARPLEIRRPLRDRQDTRQESRIHDRGTCPGRCRKVCQPADDAQGVSAPAQGQPEARKVLYLSDSDNHCRLPIINHIT